jgi:secondary thiamine-phosphate synthase enzyme
MAVETHEFSFEAEGFCHLEDVTTRVQDCLDRSQIENGIACVAVLGSTAGVSTVEYEPGLKRDIPEFFEHLFPSDRSYHHDETWHDGNGFSHLRSFLLKTSHVVPFNGGRLCLGTWQQIVVANFDNRPRTRRVLVQLVGD